MNKNEENLRKNEKTLKKKQKTQEQKEEEKKRKRGPKGGITPPRRAQKLFFYIRTVKRNRNEIEAQKKLVLSPRQKKKNLRK